ncbi:hypothetical protein N7457_008983 [Penicillium paradoxum]|uniref:uncharacterized protein n=1 Tax=Penicillium paradoxum TaxID=176176 RepID=UPI002548D5D3|nr:uncharacterized protein N7457_008983 [Penicillium paradoxum]KAJ5774087.1 hypothetical protein N7457_008983 [Penicillium paradoxum]
MASTTDTDTDFDPIYYPDLQRFMRGRSERLAALGAAPVLPEILRPGSNTEMSWEGTGLDPNSYTWEISGSELEDIDRCCAEYTSSGRTLHEIEKGTFRLPSTLADQLAARRHDLHHGAGISLLRGLQPKTRTQRENFILFAGLASHLSEQRGRQFGNKYLVHVTDLTAGDDSKKYAAPYCNQELPFHTDVGDVVAMFVFCSAANGGDGTFAPVSTIYNKLMQSSPDLIPVLLESDWPFDRSSGEIFYKRPVMFLNDDQQPEMVFSRGALIRSARGQRPLSIPKLTRVQCEALDAVHFAAVEATHTIQYQEGDLLIFNNRRILHGRNAFADTGDTGQRHMVRLWLKDEELAGKPTNLALQKLWDKTFARGNEGGYHERHWPSVPDPY